MAKRRRATPQFAICVRTDDPDLITPRMVYRVLPDETAAKSNFIRIIDNEGEDYLYPASYFVTIELPQEAQEAVLRAS